MAVRHADEPSDAQPKPRADEADGPSARLALFGAVLVEVSLVHFDKVPFTCSYLPGKANIQIIFWGFAVVFLILGMLVAAFEMDAFVSPLRYFILIGGSVATALAIWTYNLVHARSAVLYYEETSPEVITPPRTRLRRSRSFGTGNVRGLRSEVS